LLDDQGHLLKSWPATKPSDMIRQVTPIKVDGTEIPRYEQTKDLVQDLPRIEGVGYIVSRAISKAVERSDCYFPFGQIRDGEQLIGYRGLAYFAGDQGPADGLFSPFGS